MVVNACFGRCAVERHPSAEKILGIDIAEDQVRVGDGRRRAAVAITRGPRHGARRFAALRVNMPPGSTHAMLPPPAPIE